MCKIKIATDSTADIPKSFCEELDISVLPLTILAGENEYRDGVYITPAEFYKIIVERICESDDTASNCNIHMLYRRRTA